MADGAIDYEDTPDDNSLRAVLGKRKTPEASDETETVQAGPIPPPPTDPTP